MDTSSAPPPGGPANQASAIRLNPALDIASLRAAYATRGRIQVRDILEPAAAERLHEAMCAETAWNLVCRAEGTHRDFDAAGMAALDERRRAQFLAIVHAAAQRDFQYLYENHPVYDLYWTGKRREGVLAEAYEFLNGDSFLAFARALTGADDITFCDAQVTRYGPGHFLTSHDDAVENKNRRAAYVLNMTPGWRGDWGGLLQFFGEDGNVTEAFTPAFNVLNIFSVPQPHSVSLVAPFAEHPRHAITGWLRSGDPAKAHPAPEKRR